MKYRIRWKFGTVEGQGRWWSRRDHLDEITAKYNAISGDGTHWVEEERV